VKKNVYANVFIKYHYGYLLLCIQDISTLKTAGISNLIDIAISLKSIRASMSKSEALYDSD
jgi:hypothetical protein